MNQASEKDEKMDAYVGEGEDAYTKDSGCLRRGCLFILCIPLLAALIWLAFQLVPSLIYRDWQTIEIEYVGHFRVPEDWVFTEKNGVIYFTNREFEDGDTLEDVTLYMFLSSVNVETWQKVTNDTRTNTFFNSINWVRQINNRASSSALAHYGEALVEIDGEEIVKFWIGMMAGNVRMDFQYVGFTFVVIDESVTTQTIRRIARSYLREEFCEERVIRIRAA